MLPGEFTGLFFFSRPESGDRQIGPRIPSLNRYFRKLAIINPFSTFDNVMLPHKTVVFLVCLFLFSKTWESVKRNHSGI